MIDERDMLERLEMYGTLDRADDEGRFDLLYEAAAEIRRLRKLLDGERVEGWAAPGAAGEWVFQRIPDGSRGGLRPAVLLIPPPPEPTKGAE